METVDKNKKFPYGERVRLERWLSPACRQAGVESGAMDYFVYILKSLKDGGLYIGKTNNVARRLAEHNSWHTSSTRSHRPFVLLKTTLCKSEPEARRIEKEFKKGYKREAIKQEFDL